MITKFPNGVSSFGNVLLGGLGIGNVYYVVKTADTEVYQDMLRKFGDERYADGSKILYLATLATADVAIQQALDACMENRNDYVVIMPSNADYDTTAAIAINKKSVHLVCPSGLGPQYGATNAARIHQTASAAVIAISDANVEVSGLYFKNYVNKSHITLAATSYALNIHHNTFTMNFTSTSGEPCIAGTGDAGAWGSSIEWNWFVSYAGGSAVVAIMCVKIQTSATCTNVCNNMVTVGDTQTATIAIANDSVKGNTNFNIFSESGGDGVTSGGTITACIRINGAGAAIGNRGAVDGGHLLSGGTTDHSFCHNIDGATGANAGHVTQLES